MRKLYLDTNLQIVFCVTLMAIVSVSSVVPVLPDMIRNIQGLTRANVGLVITAFTLPGVLMAPVTGILGDRLGRKKVLVPSLFVFGFFGAACFFARDLHTLLVLRFLQGMGAGPLGMINLTIIGDLYEDRERLTAMGYNGSVLAAGTAAFPAIGGLLALLGWNWPFILPVLALPLGALVILKLHAPEPKDEAGLGAYLRDAARGLRRPEALALFCITLLTFIVLYGPIITYLPLLLDHRFGTSAPRIGLIISMASLVTALASWRLGHLASRFRPRTLLGSAFFFYAASMLTIPMMPGEWWVILPVLSFGLGQGLNVPTLMATISGLAPGGQRAVFMAANGMILRLSQTIAPLLMGGLYAAFGLHAVYWAGTVCALCMFLLLPLVGKAGERAEGYGGSA
ncbi:MFS transporter [Paucidesulfovibrio longus]|uniref:MFS transporter n=1 Tax=Paucidesulfovibrio longus TaxID=889 RepID=UPI0003B31457|nr:MFS transporter [Paucidesulfovibrio longus]